MKSLIVTITILAWVGMIAGMVALAATEGTVTATVTASQISISVTDGTVTYGSVALGATNDTATGTAQETQKAENTGNATAIFNIKGSNSADWTITTGTPTGEDYRHRVATTPGTWEALDTSYTTFLSSIAADASQEFDLEILISTGTVIETQQNVNVYLQATQ